VISTLLRAEAMTAGYGKMAILHGVSLIIAPGELVAVIGPNGAGKSTAFKVIVGFLKPTEGRVLFDGDDITGLRPDQVLRRGLAYVPQGRIVFPQMTVLENLEMGGYTERNPARIRAALERVYSLFPILAERRYQKAGTMSGGEQQMVAIGRALMTIPKLVLLDEPSSRTRPRPCLWPTGAMSSSWAGTVSRGPGEACSMIPRSSVFTSAGELKYNPRHAPGPPCSRRRRRRRRNRARIPRLVSELDGQDRVRARQG
jgi:ABC-type branched-subunit amino acid transport system ATPase component